MPGQQELVEILPHYLREHHQLSEAAIRSLALEWNEQGSMVDFLVRKSLLTRSTARTLEAVSKGYLNSPFAQVLGITAKPLPVIALSAAADAETSDDQHLTIEIAAAEPETEIETIEQFTLPLPTAVAQHACPTRATTGMQLGRFTLQEQLGAGVTGTVFRAFHPTLSIPVAIKVFDPFEHSGDGDAQNRFLREAQTLARLQHPNIVRVLEVDTHEQFPYIVMEYVGERTLATQIQTCNKLPAPRIAQIGLAVADALDFTWKQGLLHRDVKPANILERRDGRIKLADFGISTEQKVGGGLSDPAAALGYVSGTPSFIAPEQVLTPNDLDFRADMYGLGATLYNAAVGFPPFAAATAYDTIMAQLYEDPVPITQIDPSFDADLAAVIHRMLQRNRQDRFGSWAEARAALKK